MERLLSVINITTHIGIRDRAMVETAYCCALRLNEMLKLTIFNTDFDNRTLRVPGKGKKERILPLGKQAVKWLKEYMIKARPHLAEHAENTNCDLLWLSDEGKAVSERSYQNMLRCHAEKANLSGKVTGHSMRRACATHMLKNGAHPVAVQHLLGHADLHTLRRYLNLTLDDLRKAHAKSKLGR
jgi:integrase/recombinase XerD